MINDFDYEKLTKEYQEGEPFRHVIIDNFFDEEIIYNNYNYFNCYIYLQRSERNIGWKH